MINILSIDLDWIMEPSIEAYNNIVEDYDPEKSWKVISEFMPGLSYEMDYNKYYQICKFLFNENNKVPNSNLVIVNSHEKIIEAIKEWNINESFKIYNVDHHHDCGYFDKSCKGLEQFINNLECGNWVSYLKNINPRFIQYTWIKNKNSFEPIIQYAQPFVPNLTVTEDINVLEPIKFDYIFICKSLSWIPLKYHPLINSLLFAVAKFNI